MGTHFSFYYHPGRNMLSKPTNQDVDIKIVGGQKPESFKLTDTNDQWSALATAINAYIKDTDKGFKDSKDKPGDLATNADVVFKAVKAMWFGNEETSTFPFDKKISESIDSGFYIKVVAQDGIYVVRKWGMKQHLIFWTILLTILGA